MPESTKTMNPRKTKKLVNFPAPFQLQAMEEMRPAGVYEITIGEQQIGDFMFEAFRHISTTIHLPPRGGDFGMGQTIPVDPLELQKLLKLTSPQAAMKLEPLWMKNWLSAT
jgi:hypothetical protein